MNLAEEIQKGKAKANLCGLKEKEYDGWSIIVSVADPETTVKILNQKGIFAEEVRHIGEVFFNNPHNAPDTVVVGGFFECMMAENQGWNFDKTAKTWRAPDEPLTEPEGTPQQADQLDVDITSPDGFDIRIEVSANNTTAEAWGSLIMSQYLTRLSAWLENISKGYAPSITMDNEGEYFSIEIYTRDPENIRLRVIADTRKKENHVSLDILCRRKEFVKKFYDAFCTLTVEDFSRYRLKPEDLGHPLPTVQTYLQSE